ncbi:HNH endonuclease [Vibrio phage D69]
MLTEAVKESESIMGVLRYLGKKEAGGSRSHYSRRIKKLDLDTSHFKGRGWNKGSEALNKKSAGETLILRTEGNRQKPHRLRRCLIESGIVHECAKCGQGPEWRGNPLTLDIDHINENWLDDRLENLQFLCPNCHSQYSRNIIGRVA